MQKSKVQNDTEAVPFAVPINCCGSGAEQEGNGVGLGFNRTSNQTLLDWLRYLTMDESEIHGDGSKAIRIVIATVYSVVCALGLVGNMLVLYLLYSQHKKKRSTVNFFVMCLAVTDFQFVLTLPFWAVDTAMDFRWPFGKVMCKIVSSVTTMSMYASVFFLTAMSVARYCSVASSLKMRPHPCACSTKWVSLLIWLVSLLATLPHAIYSTTALVTDEELCLVRFPDSGWDPQILLGLYQTQKVLLGFVIPLVIISLCYILLLRFVLSRRVRGAGSESSHHQRRSKVTRSVTVVVLSFFLCWLPNQALTLWGVFIKFDLVPFSKAFYNAQAYVFPLTVCLAHTNSCLNPVLYCLIRREFRALLGELLRKVTPSFRRISPVRSHFTRKNKVAESPLVIIQMDRVASVPLCGR
ncbi:relaxin family peptide receptor 3.2b [Polyodon spathula]|uniref:relaxin family peptide receptor 3.2b n=1 Tax=Polyodon spathula TaxID=7913 RepID=UPI001B7DA67D|nr:relaxin family peptide receptor 3.2b [Polyodon spathula]